MLHSLQKEIKLLMFLKTICTSKISYKVIFVSPRNKNIAKRLKGKFRKVKIAKNNQEIIDKSNWVFLAVTPKVGTKILPKLRIVF